MLPATVTKKPGIDAETVTLPDVNGSNATPPAATDVGEFCCPAAITTVRDVAPPALVTSCAAVVDGGTDTVTVKLPPTLTLCPWLSAVPAGFRKPT